MMLIYDMLLFADRSRLFRDMGSGFREKRESFEPTDLLWWLLVVAVLLAGFLALAGYLARRDKQRLYNSPRAMFNALCVAHGLDRPSRSLLKQLARSQRLEPTARIFLEPEYFDPAMLAPDLAVHKAAVAALHHKLFAREVSTAS